MTKHSIWLSAFGVFLAAFILTGAPAVAGTSGPDQVSVKSATGSETGVQICKSTKGRCLVRCRYLFARRRCRPGSVCRFITTELAECVWRGGRCWLQWTNKVLLRTCSAQGWCSARIKRCRCRPLLSRPSLPIRR